MRLRNRRRAQAEMQLNITSMMDMFTIILVFLLFSFKAKDETFSMAKGIELPKSTSSLDLVDALNIQMASDSLVVQEDVVAKLVDGRLQADVAVEGDKIVPLYERIVAFRENRKPPEPGSEDVVIFQADRRVRFQDIDRVMKTAAMAGFPNFRFAVMKR